MKIFNTPFAAAAAAALLLALSPAHASGDHPGGHAAAPTGAPGKAAQVSRTIAVELTDSFRLVPDRIRVRQGETVRFALRNSGQLPHEFVLGSEASNRAHAEEMKRMPGMAQSAQPRDPEGAGDQRHGEKQGGTKHWKPHRNWEPFRRSVEHL